MASTASPRDHDADANSDVSRKRQRLSDEISSQGSTVGSPLIEALPTEALGDSEMEIIQIEDDDQLDPYSTSFKSSYPWAIHLPALSKDIAANFFIEPKAILDLSDWLQSHLADSFDDGRDTWLRKYTQEDAFFGELALVLDSLNRRTTTLFEGTTGQLPKVQAAIFELLKGTAKISTRIIGLLDTVTNQRLSRRDSGQIPIGQQEILLLRYITVLETLVCGIAPCFGTYRLEFGLVVKNSKEVCKHVFLEDGQILPSLATVFRNLARNHESVKDPWIAINSTMKITESYPSPFADLLEDILDDVTQKIRPTICEKHPRVLNDSFHAFVAKFGSDSLRRQALGADVSSCARLFHKFVESDQDALLPKARSDETENQVFLRVCDNDLDVLSWLLQEAWLLQTYKAFILSNIIDVRTSGIKLLSTYLVETYRVCRETHQNNDHPVAQYAARFLRTNEITRYIFSADSHANLVTHSDNIVSFLAATGSYTDQETDVIWEACATNVEAEFVKASVSVLNTVSRYLNFNQLRHVISRYSNTPISKLSTQAVDLLPELFNWLHVNMPRDGTGHLAAPNLAVDLFRHMCAEDQQPPNQRLKAVTIREISKAANMHSTHRFAVYEGCITDIKELNHQATTSMQILGLFLKHGIAEEEGLRLLTMLPVSEVLRELCHHVDEAAKSALTLKASSRSNIINRLEVVLCMLRISAAEDNAEAEDTLYRYLFGEKAANNAMREVAWIRLGELTISGSTEEQETASDLMNRYLTCHVADLPAQYATKPLIERLLNPLRALINRDATESESPKLLHDPLWKALVRFATESTDRMTAEFAIEVTCNLLFHYPKHLKSKKAILQCQSDFARDYVAHICRSFSSVDGEFDVPGFCQSIRVLSAVHEESKKTEATFQLSEQPEAIKIGDVSAKSDQICFEMRLHTPRAEQRAIRVQASTSVTVAELAEALPEHTIVTESRIIVGGKQIDLSADGLKCLAEVGVANSGVIKISPKYTLNSDVNKILTRPGPVEHAILEQYEQFSDFIDGPAQVAESVLSLLIQLPPPNRTRSRVSSQSAADLFPPNRPWRTYLSISILRAQLSDLARLGVADEDFILHGIRTMTEYVLDEKRVVDASVACEVFGCLMAFMQERPSSTSGRSYFIRPDEFAASLVKRLLYTTQMPREQPTEWFIRAKLAHLIYETLLKAFTIQPEVWQAFTKTENLIDLHVALLSDDDESYSRPIAERIIGFCGDQSSPAEATTIFWDAVYSALGQAMKRPTAATFFFKTALELINLNTVLQTSESGIRDVIECIASILWTYKHTETPECPLADRAMIGILSLLGNAVSVLKAFKKPLKLNQLSTELFAKFLFPSLKDFNAHPLLSGDSRKLVFGLVQKTCVSGNVYRNLIELTNTALESMEINISGFPGHDNWIRSPDSCAGLTNLGMTCYMNSLLQQLFANLSFRKFIFNTSIVDPQRQALLFQVQALFTWMQNSACVASDTSQLAAILGIKVDSQEDVHGFYATFMSGLEDSMPDADARKSLKAFFTGNFISQIRGECGHVSTQTEPFIDLSITVKNKASLQESLDEFVQGEPMQGSNKYKCQTCDPDNEGSFVDAMKRTCLDNVPDNLTFCLKRFTFEAMMGYEGKVNDRFDFPPEIDMGAYQRSHVENPEESMTPDKFDLVGVIVHQGTLEFGHYWSYVRLAGSGDSQSAKWTLLEDGNVRICERGFEQVQDECAGGKLWTNGNEKADNAYVLFYQRQAAAHEQTASIESVGSNSQISKQFPPRVEAPSKFQAEILQQNLCRHRTDHLFSDEFAEFFIRLTDSFSKLPPQAVANEADEAVDDQSCCHDDTLDELVADMASKFLLRVLLRDQNGAKKITRCLEVLGTALSAYPSLALPLLRCMSDNHMAFVNIWRYEHFSARTKVSDFVQRCVDLMRENNPECYKDALQSLLQAHASMAKQDLDNYHAHWQEYFKFSGTIAKAGLAETTLVLDNGSVKEALDILTLFWQDAKRERLNLVNGIKRRTVEMGPLFQHVFDVVNENVCLDPDSQSDSLHYAGHAIDGDLVSLSTYEWSRLTFTLPHNIWGLAQVARLWCDADLHWGDFPPGKLIAVLVGPRSSPRMTSFIFNRLLTLIHEEETRLQPVLHMILHFFDGCQNQVEITLLLKGVCKVMPQWEDGCEDDFLLFFQEAYKMHPVVVVEHMVDWVLRYLFTPKATPRRKTLAFLQQYILLDPSENFTPHDEAKRMGSVRSLAFKLVNALMEAYGMERKRTKYEQMMDAVIVIREWQIRYGHAMHAARDASTDRARFTALTIELPETQRQIVESTRCLDNLKDWETTSSFFTGGSPTLRGQSMDDFEEASDFEEGSSVEEFTGGE